MEHLFPRMDRRQSHESRMLSAVSGGALLFLGIRRGSFFGGLLSLAGTNLLVRGITGHSLLETMGVTRWTNKGAGASIPHQLGVQVRESVQIDRAPAEIYSFVRDFRNLPRFMNHLNDVEVHDEVRSRWSVRGPARTELHCDVEIINEIENKLLAWRSVNSPDIDIAGSIRFDDAPGAATIVTVSLQYLPAAGAVGVAIGKLLGNDPDFELKQDLRRLRQILDTGEVAHGGDRRSEQSQISEPSQASSSDTGERSKSASTSL